MKYFIFSILLTVTTTATAQLYTVSLPTGTELFIQTDGVYNEYRNGDTFEAIDGDEHYYLIPSNCTWGAGLYSFSLIDQQTGVETKVYDCCEPMPEMNEQSATLPVTISALRYDNGAVVWTAHESGTVYRYDVQRSRDGVNFETFDTVTAKNNGTYTYNVAADGNGVTYYRIQSVSDAGTEYSRIIVAQERETAAVTAMYTLSGQPVNRINTGGLYVVRRGNVATVERR